MMINVFLLLLGCFIVVGGCGSDSGTNNTPSRAGDTPGSEKLTVYGTGTVAESTVSVSLFADIPAPVVSYGVRLNYPADALRIRTAEKNEKVWYIGDGKDNMTYMGPETDVDGAVTMVGACLDTSAPSRGVSGTAVLLGNVTFDRIDGVEPDDAAMTLTYAREGDYVNFATPTGTAVDGEQVMFGGVTLNRTP